MNWAGFESGRGLLLDSIHYPLPPVVEFWELYFNFPIRVYDVTQACLQLCSFCVCVCACCVLCVCVCVVCCVCVLCVVCVVCCVCVCVCCVRKVYCDAKLVRVLQCRTSYCHFALRN